MFVPRAVWLKVDKKYTEQPKQTTSGPPAKKAHLTTPLRTFHETNASRKSNQEVQNDAAPAQDTRFTVPQVTHEYLGWLVTGMEMIFSDYAHESKEGVAWLEKHYRKVDGEEKYVHVSAILEHPHISSLNKPSANIAVLQRALQEQSSSYLELAKNGYFVRRRPASYPACFVPQNSFDTVDDSGIDFWDQRTIYVEPHIRGLCKTPAKLAYWLKMHGDIRAKWLPIQDVQFLFNSCAFIILSGNVTHESIWNKWREKQKPEYWKVLTKFEHSKRTEEYLELLNKEASMKKERIIERNTGQMPTQVTKKTTKKRKRQHESVQDQ